MRKYRRLVIELCAVVLIPALFALAALYPAYGEICEQQANSADKYCTTYNVVLYALFKVSALIQIYNGAITALATVVITVFTVMLALVARKQTQLIEDTAEVQRTEAKAIAEASWQQTNESIQAAIRTANAASEQAEASKKQAEAATAHLDLFDQHNKQIERPYVIVSDVSRIISGWAEKFSYRNGWIVTVKVGNYGRTPALLHVLRHQFKLGQSDRAPDNPYAKGVTIAALSTGNDFQIALAPAYVVPDPVPLDLPKLIKVEAETGPKLSKGQTIYLFVAIQFEDMAHVTRRRVGTWRYDTGIHAFAKYGGDEYNYETEISPSA